MELSSPRLKNLLYFLKKNFLIFWEIELTGPKIKSFLLFSQKNVSYISGNKTF